MNEMLIYLLLGLVFVVLVMQILQLLRNRRELSAEALGLRFQVLESGLERLERELRSEIARSRTESVEAARGDRAEQSQSLERLGKGLATQVGQLGTLQTQQFDAFGQHLARLTQSFDGRAEQLRQSVETRLSAIQTDNAAKLEEMRKTVDEKLHATLEQRLGESFKLVSDRLEQVHRGLGEMQTLASGVGDLKKMLTNVKTRGTWGEVQLAALLDQVLTAEQYAANVATRPRSNERVEFAIKLPGREEGEPVWLPIDAKFPVEDYQRLVEAQESADAVAAEAAAKALEIRLKDEGRKIRENISSRCSRQILPSSTCRPRDCTPKPCDDRAWRNGYSVSSGSRLPARRHLPRCSIACRWASAHWPSSAVPLRSGWCWGR